MDEPKVTISRRGAERLQRGHLWIYRADVERAPPALGGGEVVLVADGRGRFLAKAFWSARSKIALRVVTRDEGPVDEPFFARRLAAAVDGDGRAADVRRQRRSEEGGHVADLLRPGEPAERDGPLDGRDTSLSAVVQVALLGAD